MDTAYLLPVGGVHLQWFGPGDGCSANVLYQKHHSGLVGRCQGAVIPVGFGPDGSLKKHSLVTVQLKNFGILTRASIVIDKEWCWVHVRSGAGSAAHTGRIDGWGIG